MNSSTSWLDSALAPYPRRPFVLEVRTGVDGASVHGAGSIHGRWKEYGPILRIDSKIRLLEDFANWADDPRSILRFTKRYGPLDLPFKGGQEFHFTIKQWRRRQKEFRDRWEKEMVVFGKPINVFPFFSFKAKPGEAIEVSFGKLSFRTSTLYRLLVLGLYSRSSMALKKCGNPECDSSYFLCKERRKQTYCSDLCARWAQKKWKREWWNKHGARRRREARAKAKKGPVSK